MTKASETLEEGLSLKAGSSKEYTVFYIVTPEDVADATTHEFLTNTAKAEAKYKQEELKPTAQEQVPVRKLPNMEITKTKVLTENRSDKTDGKAITGDEITYTITVKNTGNTVQENVKVEDVMKFNGATRDDLVITDVKVNGTTATVQDGKINVGRIAINGTATITAKYVVVDKDIDTEVSNEISNTATVTSKAGPTLTSNEAKVETEIGTTNITYTKTSTIVGENKTSVKFGDVIEYTITAKNSGTKNKTTTISDELPTGVSIVPGSLDSDTTYTTADGKTTVNRTLNVPAFNVPASFTFKVTVNENAIPGSTIDNVAVADDTEIKDEDGPMVEEEVKIKTSTTSTKIQNSNVLIILDRSKSMDQNNRWDIAVGKGNYTGTVTEQGVLMDFMDDILDGGSSFAMIGFNDEAKTITYENKASGKYIVTTDAQANIIKGRAFKTDANHGYAPNGGTNYEKPLILANSVLDNLAAGNDRQNIVIFLSDGDKGEAEALMPKDEEDGEEVEKTPLDLALEELKSKATIYSIGFGQNNKGLQRVASDKSKYFSTVSDSTTPDATVIPDLSTIFSRITEEISPNEPEPATSERGLIQLDSNIIMDDASKPVTITVKARGTNTVIKTITGTGNQLKTNGVIVDDEELGLCVKLSEVTNKSNEDITIEYFTSGS